MIIKSLSLFCHYSDPIPSNGLNKTLTACEVGFFNNCTRPYDIDVKNCSSFLVYKLKPSDVCNSAYCFGNMFFFLNHSEACN